MILAKTAEVIGTIVDVTQRKRAEAERERLRQWSGLAHTNRVSMMENLQPLWPTTSSSPLLPR